jgi:uncharacterized protein (TIGR02391 family)
VADSLGRFEKAVRRAGSFTSARSEPAGGAHPFDERNLHQKIQQACRRLFDDSHYANATLEAYKLLDTEVEAIAKTGEFGTSLMMKAFSETSPLIKLTKLGDKTEIGEQQGYKFLFAGSNLAIRNPRAHVVNVKESPTECLDHLSLASMLLRRLEKGTT